MAKNVAKCAIAPGGGSDQEPRSVPARRHRRHPGSCRKRSSDREFREVADRRARDRAQEPDHRGAVLVREVNTLILAVPLYLFQISDRVLTSRSMDTLVMLTIIVIVALIMHVLVDIVRASSWMRTAVEVESKLGAGGVERGRQGLAERLERPSSRLLGDLQQLRSFITGPVLLDHARRAGGAALPAGASSWFTPISASSSRATALVLLVIASHQPAAATAKPVLGCQYIRRARDAAGRRHGAQCRVLNAMGMVPEGCRRSGAARHVNPLKNQVLAQDRNILLAGISKLIPPR